MSSVCAGVAALGARCYRCCVSSCARSECHAARRPHCATPVVDVRRAAVVFTLQRPLHEECPVCLEDMLAGDRVAAYPCAHRVHEDCAQRWMKFGERRCPTCNTE